MIIADLFLVNKPGFGSKAASYSMVFFRDRLALARAGEDSWEKMIAKEAIGELGISALPQQSNAFWIGAW